MQKIRLIQCGVGGFGKGWLLNHSSKSPDFDVVAIVDVNAKTLAESGESANIPAERRFLSLQDALDRVQADAVLTVTPPAVHLEHAKLAFSRGLHVMTEKPIAGSMDNALEMVKLARQANRQLVVSQQYRYRPFVATLRRLVQEKVVGDFGHGHLDFYIPADFTGTFRQSMEHVLLVDMAIHHLDLIRAITGRNIVKVFAQTFKPSWSWYDHNPGLKMMLELEGGLPFSYSGDWSGRGRKTTWHGNWRLQCAEGSVHLENDQVSIARSSRGYKDDVQVETVESAPLEREGQSQTLKLFADAIRKGNPAEISGGDNLWSFAAVMSGIVSTNENRVVDVSELMAR